MYPHDKLKVIVASIIVVVLVGYYMIFGKDNGLMVLCGLGMATWLGVMLYLRKRD